MFIKKVNKILLFFIVIFLISGCQKKEVAVKSVVEEVIPVKAMKVVLQDIEETLDYVGSIKAQEEANIYPKVTGKIIEKVKQEGDIVQKGDVIAYVDRDEVGLKFEKAPIESTITGVVGRINVDIGESVNPSVSAALVVDISKVKINLDIPEKYFSRLSIGQEARILVDAYAGVDFNGTVTKISPVLDLATRSAPIEILIDNKDGSLKSGMFARVALILQKYQKVPVIIKESVIGHDSQVYVYIVENSKAVMKKVTLGMRHNEFFQVKEGLKENDVVVIMGQQRLREGVTVLVE